MKGHDPLYTLLIFARMYAAGHLTVSDGADELDKLLFVTLMAGISELDDARTTDEVHA